MKFLGKAALVTGSSRGIGRAIALHLAEQGAGLWLHCHRECEQVQKVSDLCGPGTRWVQADLSLPGGRQKLVSALPQQLDFLVHNAGLTHRADWDTQDEESLDRMWALHVKAPLFLTGALASRLREGGRVILITSHLTEVLSQGEVGYALTKSAQAALVRPLASQLGGRNITVNAVSPGSIKTDMEAEVPAQETLWQQAIKRLGEPEDVAGAVSFLCSSEASWITGQTLSVEGGFGL